MLHKQKYLSWTGKSDAKSLTTYSKIAEKTECKSQDPETLQVMKKDTSLDE